MMFRAQGVTRSLQCARSLLMAGMVGSLLLGCSSSGGDTGPGTGGKSNAGGSTATGGATSTGGSGAGGGMNTGGTVGTGGSVAAGGSLAGGGSMATRMGGAAAGGGVAIGGMANSGGATETGGSVVTGGTIAGGITSTAATTAGGGAVTTGGIASTAATTAGGGAVTTGGSTGSGGTRVTGGTVSSGGSQPTGGTGATGGQVGLGGTIGSGGTSGTGGTSGSGGMTTAVTGPCDIYASGNTPCVAAHSTVRALAGAYKGNLYQVKRASDKTSKDIAVLSPGGFADSAAQDTFCTGTTCTISIIYDQSGKGNHLTSAPAGGAKNSPDNEATANALKLTVGGHSVYGVHIPAGVGYRNDKTSGIATGDQPESEYMVTSGNYYNGGCCFDYGNAETNNNDDGAGTMEAVYFGNSTGWGKGSGPGPWVMADLENGLFAGKDFGPTATNTSLTSTYVTAMVTGRSGTFAIKGGNAQSGALTTMYDGARPTMTGYNPMKKQGAIILGIGGDNSNSAQGNFFEGCMTSGASSTATDDAVQANIVAAGYGH